MIEVEMAALENNNDFVGLHAANLGVGAQTVGQHKGS